MIERLGDADIEEKYKNKMVALAGAIDAFFNGDTAAPRSQNKPRDDREVGFVLLVFPFGEGQHERCNFISNGADRRDIVTLFKEMIARFEGQPEVTGHG